MSDRRSFRIHVFCDVCRCAVAVKVRMLTAKPTVSGQEQTRWLQAADRDCRAKFEREHAAECRGRRA